jgi:signal transduction histidine kinase
VSADTAGELLALRNVARDLVALSAMSAVWVGREPAGIAGGLADALIGLLRLDSVYVRLCVPGVPQPVDATRGETWEAVPAWLDSRRTTSAWRPGMEIVSVDGGPETRRAAVIPVGVNAEGGVVAAACDRIDFPTEIDQLLLSLAANHAAAAFQSARLKEHQAQLRFLENLDRIDRAMHGRSDLDVDRMLGDVLDVVVSTFECDRAWLVYPCDPEADSLRTRMQRTRAGQVGARRADEIIANDAEAASVSRIVLDASGPVRFGPGSDWVIPRRQAERFDIKSMIGMAVSPKVDKPYLFALHQCSHPRTWTPAEERLFHEIGRRLADALDTLLMLNNLRESERKLERSRAELAASRARIVSAADETRREIERDLHDGVQQRLVSLVLAQRTTEAMVPPELPDVSEQLVRLRDGLAGALKELQEIARGIHPAILTRGGLAPALRALGQRSAVPVELDLRIATRLPEAVEVAAYYVVSEALTNVAKHARASAVDVTVDARADVLELSIRDDGRGGADPTRGSGLLGLIDRVDVLGGTIEVESPRGIGTTLLVTLPIEPTDRDGSVGQ